MSLRFRGGDRFQRGRAIGGLFRIAKYLFKPMMGTIWRAVKSKTGRAIGRALNEYAINTGKKLLADAVAGNDLKQGLDRKVGNLRQRGALAIQQLKSTHRSNEPYEDESELEYEPIPIKKKKKQIRLKENNLVKQGSAKTKFNFV